MKELINLLSVNFPVVYLTGEKYNDTGVIRMSTLIITAVFLAATFALIGYVSSMPFDGKYVD